MERQHFAHFFLLKSMILNKAKLLTLEARQGESILPM